MVQISNAFGVKRVQCCFRASRSNRFHVPGSLFQVSSSRFQEFQCLKGLKSFNVSELPFPNPCLLTQIGRRNPQSEINNPQSAIRNPQSAIRIPQSAIRNPKSLIRHPQSPIRNPQSEIRNPKSPLYSTTISSKNIQHLFPAPGCHDGQIPWLRAINFTKRALPFTAKISGPATKPCTSLSTGNELSPALR